MSKDEKNNILDQHKYLYDGYVTIYNQENNKTPIYVQDLANDKMGLTVNNKGVVKPYGNMGINESHKGLDMIGGDSHDQSEMKYRHLKNGTSDLDNEMFYDDNQSPNEDEFDYISLGTVDDDDEYDEYDNRDLPDFPSTEDYESKEPFDFEEVGDEDLPDFPSTEDYESKEPFDFEEVDDDDLPDFIDKLQESLDMFKRFKKYN
jgi:hypothetical protein